MCPEGLNSLRNSDLVSKNILSFLRRNVRSKFPEHGEIIPFVFKGGNMSLENAKIRSVSIFVKPTTASKFRGKSLRSLKRFAT